MKTRKEDGEMVFLEGLITNSPSGAIENQEARGQQSFVNSADLPAAVNTGAGKEMDDVLVGWGIKLGEPYPHDPIFRPVELPEGWKKKPTDHSMWNRLVDDKGRERAKVFYKAAFYDRSAFIVLCNRFSVEQNFDDFQKMPGAFLTKIQYQVLDVGTPVFSVDPVDTPVSAEGKEDYQASIAIDKEQIAACKKWLKECYPDWKDPAKYWEEEDGSKDD